MNIFDVVLALLIVCGGVVGFKRGFFKEIVMTVGYLALIVISLFLKNPIAEFLSMKLPFFEFGGEFQGLVVLNIFLYQVIAFLLVLVLLGIVFNALLFLSNAIEKLLNITIIGGVLSKILGMIVGFVEGYIIVFIISVVLSFPVFNQEFVMESKLRETIVTSTPVLSGLADELNDSFNDVSELIKTSETHDVDKFNRDTVDIMLRHKLIEPDYVQELIDAKKMKVPGLQAVVNEYK